MNAAHDNSSQYILITPQGKYINIQTQTNSLLT